MATTDFLGLFEAYGIEAEYMVVDESNLSVVHGVEDIMRDFNEGEITDYVELGDIALSNELVDHVIEFKGKGPIANIQQGDELFHQAIVLTLNQLKKRHQTLMGTGMHPFMIPKEEMRLWPHGQKDIYQTYDRIFSCQGHGWSNLQSVHLNLPFKNEEEFVKLHNAIRLIMPLIPALAASSPFVERALGEFPCNRIRFYEKNQARVPSITGKIIPPAHQNFADYQNMIEGMYRDIATLDPDGILKGPWLNSHGAILKLDVQAIEIRIMDIQECPLMDFAVLHFIIALLKAMVEEKWLPSSVQATVETDLLRQVLDLSNTWHDSELPPAYTRLFFPKSVLGMKRQTFLADLYQEIRGHLPMPYQKAIAMLIKNGTLSQRIKKCHDQNPGPATLLGIYQELNRCLIDNCWYLP